MGRERVAVPVVGVIQREEDVALPPSRLTGNDAAGRTIGVAADPHAPCRALRAEGVVEDFIFRTLAPLDAVLEFSTPDIGG